MNPPQAVLTLLAHTGAASSTQLGRWSGLATKPLHGVLGKLEAGQLITPAARVRLAVSGRPQTVWSLLALGARPGRSCCSSGPVYFEVFPNRKKNPAIARVMRAHKRRTSQASRIMPHIP